MAGNRTIKMGSTTQIKPKTINLSNKRKLNKFLRDYATMKDDLERIQKDMAKTLTDANELMEEVGIRHYEYDNIVAEYQRSKGKKSTSIRVKDFFKKVSLEEFIEAVSVTQKNAKKLLTPQELKDITDETPATTGLPFLAIFRKP